MRRLPSTRTKRSSSCSICLYLRTAYAGHVLDLAERLDAGEPAADEDERQQPAAQLRVPRGRRDVDAAQHVVAQRDGLLDVLEADALLGQAGDGQRARDRAEPDDEVVVGHPVRLALDRRDLDPAVRVLDLRDVALQHVDALEGAAVRGDDVARVDRPGGGLGQERRVGHVRARVDDDDGRLAVPEAAAQPAGRVQTDRAATEDEDTRHLARLAAGRRHHLARRAGIVDGGRGRLRHTSYGRRARRPITASVAR